MSDMDYTEKERLVHVEVQVPVYGNSVHVQKLRDRMESVLSLSFPEVKITDVDQTPVDE